MYNSFLKRQGSKVFIAKQIIQYFKPHNIYIEPFFGTGNIYFNKEKASSGSLLNDIDDNVFNLWEVYNNNFEDLLNKIENLFISQSLHKYFLKNKFEDKIMKALRFLYLSNTSLFGQGSFRLSPDTNTKSVLINNYKSLNGFFEDDKVSNLDFKQFFKSFSIHSLKQKYPNSLKIMCYNDPPYLGTGNNYSNSFKEQDTIDLFNINCDLAKKYENNYFFAISEFETDFIKSLTKEKQLNLIKIKDRRNLQNRRLEILITNYEIENHKNLLF